MPMPLEPLVLSNGRNSRRGRIRRPCPRRVDDREHAPRAADARSVNADTVRRRVASCALRITCSMTASSRSGSACTQAGASARGRQLGLARLRTAARHRLRARRRRVRTACDRARRRRAAQLLDQPRHALDGVGDRADRVVDEFRDCACAAAALATSSCSCATEFLRSCIMNAVSRL